MRKMNLPATRILKPRGGLVPLDLPGLWRYRDLLGLLAWRNIVVRYKQSLVGPFWALANPVLNMVIFTLIFSRVGKLPSGGAPYAVMIFAALLPWNCAAGIFTRGAASLAGAGALIQKVYFPRVILPLSSVLTELVDFALAFSVLLVLLLGYGLPLRPQLALLPAFLLLGVITALGPALWLGTLNVKYRDVGQIAPVLARLGMFVTPVLYDAALVPERWRLLYGLNPMVGVIDGFRWCVLGAAFTPHWPSFAIGGGLAVALFVGGLYFLRFHEKAFADVI